MSVRSLSSISLLAGLFGLVGSAARATPASSSSATASGTPKVTANRSPAPDIIPLSEVQPGMKGYGLTVFQGTKPERFDVEVIGVLRDFLPKQDVILFALTIPASSTLASWPG